MVYLRPLRPHVSPSPPPPSVPCAGGGGGGGRFAGDGGGAPLPDLPVLEPEPAVPVLGPVLDLVPEPVPVSMATTSTGGAGGGGRGGEEWLEMEPAVGRWVGLHQFDIVP